MSSELASTMACLCGSVARASSVAMKAEPMYAKSAPIASAASTASPVAMLPDSASGPWNHWRISWISANGLLDPAWPPAPAATAIRPSAPLSIALWAWLLLMMSCSTTPPQACTASLMSTRAPRLVMMIGTL